MILWVEIPRSSADVTLLLQAFLKKAGLVGFYGPAAMTQFAEFPEPWDYTVRNFYHATAEPKAMGKFQASEEWTDEVLAWGDVDLTRPRKRHPSDGWAWLKDGRASGPLTGGCLPSLLQLVGTPFQPEFKGRILFLENPDGEQIDRGSPLSFVHSQLTDLKLSGVFDQIAALFVSRPFGYDDEQRAQFREMVYRHLQGVRFPVLYNADFGHTDPILTLPLGVQSTLDSQLGQWSVDEPAVA